MTLVERLPVGPKDSFGADRDKYGFVIPPRRDKSVKSDRLDCSIKFYD
jgi:hypothetical protein